jgi:hypothetical protein
MEQVRRKQAGHQEKADAGEEDDEVRPTVAKREQEYGLEVAHDAVQRREAGLCLKLL